MCYIVILQLIFGSTKGAYKRASYLAKCDFKKFGNNCYWHPLYIPSNPSLISIGNNVTICANVKFYEHDIVHRMWNYDPSYTGPRVQQYEGQIEIGDNTVIGGSSIILYNVNIGKNVLVAAGSVVTKSVPDFSIVAGNPAKIIGDTRELLTRRVSGTGRV